MSVRPYRHDEDYDRISQFLIETFESGDRLANWLQPRWEYMHAHPYIKGLDLSAIGVAESRGQILGVVHPEHSTGSAYFQIRPGHDDVKPVLFEWAEEHLHDGGGRCGVYVNDFDVGLRSLAAARGYRIAASRAERHAVHRLDRSIEVPPPPEGFRLASLETDNDLAKIHRVLWRGFNHEGTPPADGIADRAAMQRTPGFRKDLTIVAVAPNGEYAAFGGMWYVEANRVGYVEPVATDPDYRRLGLGTSVVREILRRVARLGAVAAWVGSDQRFYEAMGFEVAFQSDLWLKES
jgi:predicted N-acetyltransferase YhbS